MLINEIAFPEHTMALARLLAPFNPLAIGCSADQQDKVRGAKLRIHPPRPAFRRSGGFDVLVDGGVDSARAQAFGKDEHALAMLRRIETVTEKDAGRRVDPHDEDSSTRKPILRAACGFEMMVSLCKPSSLRNTITSK